MKLLKSKKKSNLYISINENEGIVEIKRLDGQYTTHRRYLKCNIC